MAEMHATCVPKERRYTKQVWFAMMRRCYIPSTAHYSDYGGRGIEVCERWRGSFDAFLLDMGTRPKGLWLDRIDNNGHYEASNCRWATRLEQQQNKRNSFMITHNGKTLCVAEWSRRTGIKEDTLRMRVRRGHSPEWALTAPLQPRRICRLRRMVEPST